MLRASWYSFVRWAFARFYREFAWTYDAVAWAVSRGYWQHWVRAALPHLAGGPVLELGCGTGYLQLALAQRGYPCFGLDASPQMLRHTSVRVARSGYQPRLLRADARCLPVANGGVASIVATFPTEYILDLATLREAQRALRPGGRLLIIDGAQFIADGPYERLIDLAYRLTLQASVREQPFDDPRPALLAAAGFGVQAVWETIDQSRVQVLIGTKASDAAHD
jgi:ubiquinone/menaquinone biosynthesis C-methylase UbiE